MPSVNIHRTRRNNLLLLLREYTEQQAAAGESPVGLMRRFAELLGLSPGGLGQFKGDNPKVARNIGDAVAAQIESRMKKPKGWLDQDNGAGEINPAEIAFLELAKDAWRNSDAKGRRAMMKLARAGFIAEQ
ncbi:hypothetical protein [Polaromonas sp.]|uniref:hypothetical protein n=1 Tax=Polaromonas sp. TaxID=1869339 RepID=UPI00352B5E13